MENENLGINDLEPFVIALKNIGRKGLAIDCLDAFGETASVFGQFDNLSKCYFKIGELEKSIEFGKRALASAPTPQHTVVTRSNLINVYNTANRPEEAIAYIKFNEGIVPSRELALNKAYTLYLLNRKKEAQAILEEALVDPELPPEVREKVEFNLGTYHVAEGKFQQGLRETLLNGLENRRWRKNIALNLPFWQGTPDVENLVVFAEAGIGDEIINIRFMRHLKERGINAWWYTATQTGKKNDRPGLSDLFAKNGYNVIESLEEVSHVPNLMWTYSMQLPIYLDLQPGDLWGGPYLQPCPEHAEKWNLTGGGKKVGLRWRGSKHYEQDLRRSIPLGELHSALEGYEADYVSLQKDDGVEETKDFQGLADLSDRLGTIEDTFALISKLDFVITSCTSIAHMAASQGKKVFVFVPISTYYIWCHPTEKSPWYGDNVFVLRQQNPHSWAEPMLELRKLLEEHG